MKTNRVALVLAAAVAATAAGCGGSSGSGVAGQETTIDSGVVVGAGSTLVAPLVAQWTRDYARKQNVTITYGAIGSGGGIAQVTAKTVDFGASDAALTPDQRSSAPTLVQIPWALAATVVAYNLPGVGGHLKLTGPVVAGIYLGRITRWDDPAIKRLNPGTALPSTKIVPIYRSDSSGDTAVFTEYLSQVSPAWKTRVGTSTSVSWPAGTGGQGNAGVLGALAQTPGAIAYAAIASAKGAGASYALLRNAGGAYPDPSPASIAAAAQGARFSAQHTASIVNPPASAKNAYPMATFTYALVPKGSPKLATLKRFLRYAVGAGQSFAEHLSFAPLPASVRKADLKVIAGL
ncbi:MAG TPA: phosphate ABC transporter substrate-binding protein PstS [Gaiellaceae bacterium]|nr:phosphate ABC transporter substrate-binding protein PstS [Gaiellaceae bacterium]